MHKDHSKDNILISYNDKHYVSLLLLCFLCFKISFFNNLIQVSFTSSLLCRLHNEHLKITVCAFYCYLNLPQRLVLFACYPPSLFWSRHPWPLLRQIIGNCLLAEVMFLPSVPNWTCNYLWHANWLAIAEMPLVTLRLCCTCSCCCHKTM